MKGIQVSSNEESINSHKVNNVFSSLNQRYDIIMCVYWFELFSQVSDVAHGPLVTIVVFVLFHHYTVFWWELCPFSLLLCFTCLFCLLFIIIMFFSWHNDRAGPYRNECVCGFVDSCSIHCGRSGGYVAKMIKTFRDNFFRSYNLTI